MGTAMVFERLELKYMMSRRQREHIMKAMEPRMTADSYGHSSIRNIYYDTADYKLIRRSLDRPVYKEKLRLRSYGQAGDTDEVFIELKKKYKSVVYKRRLPLPLWEAEEALRGDAPMPPTQIGAELAYFLAFYGDLQPKAFISYERDAYVPMDGDGLRITFDENIMYRQWDMSLKAHPQGLSLMDEDQVLMELKIKGAIPMWLARALAEEKVFKTTFSKYGAAYIDITGKSNMEVREC